MTGVINCVGVARRRHRSVDFYTQALAFELVSNIIGEGQDYSDLEGVTRAKIRIVTLRLGDELIELMEYFNVERKPIPSDSQSKCLKKTVLYRVIGKVTISRGCKLSLSSITLSRQ
ncbi:hypothetical protein [Nostoc sp. 'Lobaria pulmonaria (5183) cyanobiont']|uniref:hypothetical protein n=1 Tax=Nostoc sp. 'Lobaria pulmonaria (5183) cyanobiont' TaxID=1618022 RepID=UPI001F26DEF6|nr:hypothetical protein [Nostoc sp. 'Lobaria pulmonaria (5183) cyanobiont']